jgi:hypothetical protein
VVFHDATGNGEYQPGEGLAGVTITVAGVGSTTTMDAGGYAIQLAPGTYTVTASGGGLPAPIARTIVLGHDNVRLNFDENPNGTLLDAAATGTASGRLGTFTAMATGDTAASYSARIDWGDGNATFATLTSNGDGTFNVQGSNTYASAGVYAVRVLITHIGDGQTVALNATASVSASTNSGPAFPNPAYLGQGGSGGGPSFQGGNGSGNAGSGAATQAGHGPHHKRKHPRHPPKPQHALHVAGKHTIASRPSQVVRLLGDHRPH